jgi:hypothetical protein
MQLDAHPAELAEPANEVERLVEQLAARLRSPSVM